MIVPTFIPPQQSFDATSKPTANNFIKFTISGTGDVLYALITNGDASAALQNPIPSISYSYTLYSNPNSGERELTSQYSSKSIQIFCIKYNYSSRDQEWN